MKPFLFPLVLLLAAAPVGATSFIEIPIEETLKETPIIARGTVGRSEVRTVTLPDGSHPPFTFYELKVSESLKGDLKPSTIRVRQLGGTKEGSGMVVSGAAEFSEGEEVVLMLDPPNGDDHSYPIRGLATGKYAIDRRDGTEMLVGAGISGSLPLKEVRRMIAAPVAKPPKPVASSAEPLLGERGRAAVPSPAAPSPSDADATPEPVSPVPRTWIFVVGAAIGIAFYLFRRGRR